MTWIERTAYLRLPRAVSLTELREPVTPGGDEMAWARTRKGTLRVHGKGATVRELPVHPQLPAGLARWPGQRPGWPGAGTSPALLLNRRRPHQGPSTCSPQTADQREQHSAS
jgi:hypothetical protein